MNDECDQERSYIEWPHYYMYCHNSISIWHWFGEEYFCNKDCKERFIGEFEATPPPEPKSPLPEKKKSQKKWYYYRRRRNREVR
jgi:hypothetical protein